MAVNGNHCSTVNDHLINGEKSINGGSNALKTCDTTFPSFATKAIHVGHRPEDWPYKEVIPPICLSTTFKQSSPAEPDKHDYIRAGNSTKDCLEKCLATLEDAKYCRAFSSGLAATTALSSLLVPGDHVICSDDVYGGTQRLFRRILAKNGIEFEMVCTSNAANVGKAVKPNTKMVWIESPSNPLLKVSDIAEICKLVRQRHETALVIVDNTFMSPYFQRPLTLGADVVMHSITKYINGHSDVLMGCVCTNNDEVDKQLTFYQLAAGGVPSPFDCYLVNRGVKTLHVRMERHMTNALQVACYLEGHQRVLKVFFPELPSHPHHAVHKKQTKGMSGMVSFYLDGNLEETKHFLRLLKYFILAESLGGFESLAEHPALMTHASVPKDDREKLGIGDNLIRLSVGLENAEDLITDLENALANYKK